MVFFPMTNIWDYKFTLNIGPWNPAAKNFFQDKFAKYLTFDTSVQARAESLQKYAQHDKGGTKKFPPYYGYRKQHVVRKCVESKWVEWFQLDAQATSV
jgi:hypothetical protein